MPARRGLRWPLLAVSLAVLLSLGLQEQAKRPADVPVLHPQQLRVELGGFWSFRAHNKGEFRFGQGASPADYVQRTFSPEDYTTVLRAAAAASRYDGSPEAIHPFTIDVYLDGTENLMEVRGRLADVEFLRPWIERLLNESKPVETSERLRSWMADHPLLRSAATRPATAPSP